MRDNLQEAAYLVGDSDYLHLKETESGYSYAVFHEGQPRRVYGGQIDTAAIEASSIPNPFVAARALAMEEVGLESGRVSEVSLRMLERFLDSDVRRRTLFAPETLPPDIRFIDSRYQEQFRIPDGGTVLVTYPDRQFSAQCRYLDEAHIAVNGTVFHICEFAERLERNHGSCRPEPEITEDKSAWRLGSEHYLTVQAQKRGWKYSLYDLSFHEVNSGTLKRPELSALEAREEIMHGLGMQNRSRVMLGYDFVRKQARSQERQSVREQLATAKHDAEKPKRSAPKRHEEVL